MFFIPVYIPTPAATVPNRLLPAPEAAVLPYIGCPSAFTPAPEVASCPAAVADEEAKPPYPPPETCPRVAWLAHCGACIPNPDTACCVRCTEVFCKLP